MTLQNTQIFFFKMKRKKFHFDDLVMMKFIKKSKNQMKTAT